MPRRNICPRKQRRLARLRALAYREEPEPPLSVRLDRAARSLVERGLASPLILGPTRGPYTPPTNRTEGARP